MNLAEEEAFLSWIQKTHVLILFRTDSVANPDTVRENVDVILLAF
jgi:hypothetical protein